MITHFIRRLTGRPEPAVARDVAVPAAAPAAVPLAYTLAADELLRAGMAWVFDLPDDTTHDAAAAEDAFAQLQLVAHRFDVRRMPRLPALVPQLMAALRREEADAADLASLLARDPMLAGEVMRVAGSAAYARAQRATSLQQAVQLLGAEGLRQVVLRSVLRPILRGDAGVPGATAATRLWAITEARMWLCARLATGADRGEAQLAGITAGTGYAALSRMVPQSLIADAATHPRFAQRLAEIARPLTLRAAQHWQLPGPVLDALDAEAASPLHAVLAHARALAIGHRLREADRLPADAIWPSGDPALDAPAVRDPLLAAMAAEIEPLESDA